MVNLKITAKKGAIAFVVGGLGSLIAFLGAIPNVDPVYAGLIALIIAILSSLVDVVKHWKD